MHAMIRTVSTIVQWGAMNAMATIKTPVMIQVEAWLHISENRVVIARSLYRVFLCRVSCPQCKVKCAELEKVDLAFVLDATAFGGGG